MTGFFCGWPVLCGAWEAPVFTFLASLGYAVHLLFFITRRSTATAFFMLVECAIVHVFFFAWTVAEFCDASVNYVQKIANKRERRFQYTDPNSSVKGALLGLAAALGSVPASLQEQDRDQGDDGDDDNVQSPLPALKYSPARSTLWQNSLALKGALTAACRWWQALRLTSRTPVTYLSSLQRHYDADSLLGVGLAAVVAYGAANDVARNVKEMIASYSIPQSVPIMETLTGSLACVHLMQFSAFSIQSGMKMIYMQFDICVLAHHVAGVLRRAEFCSLEDTRVFAQGE